MKEFQKVNYQVDSITMANKFTKEQTEQFQKLFSVFDKNGDGQIDMNELGLTFLAVSCSSLYNNHFVDLLETLMRDCGQKMTKAKLQEMMFEADLNGMRVW